MRDNTISIGQAWEYLFEELRIAQRVEEDGCFRISAAQINTVREARLMAKFDQSLRLPEVFRRNRLSILPVTRGEYVIGPFETHARVEYTDVPVKQVGIPELCTLDYTNLYSEASALLFAYNSGIFEDASGEERLYFTVNGRMASGNFEFRIRDVREPDTYRNLSVMNAQVEIDGGYEGETVFLICEAKNIAAEELLIRQLYYPWRLWQGKLSKRAVPVFMVYSNDIFHLFFYRFADVMNYNSLELISHKAYTFADETITRQDVEEVFYSIGAPDPEPEAVFPQADSFERVVDLLSVLFERSLTRDEVTMKYEFDERQTNYYISACEYLGLITRGMNEARERVYSLTKEAAGLMGMRYKEKYLGLVRRILRCPVFYHVFFLAMMRGEVPDKRAVMQVMRESQLDISETTILRRSATVRGWIGWILKLAKDE